MSRLGKKPLAIPEKVKVDLKDSVIKISGEHGELDFSIPNEIDVKIKDNEIILERNSDNRKAKAFHGLTASLVRNMIIGVSQKFTKTLQVIGTGYNASLAGPWLKLYVGHSHDILLEIPKTIDIEVEKDKNRSSKIQNVIKVSGCDKQLVGQIAAEIRACRPPENYKGKGVRYSDEHVIIKPGKTTA